MNRNTEDSLSKRKEIFDKTKVEEKQELIHMMNIVGNQIIHEAAGHYGWKEGSTEKLLLHGMWGSGVGHTGAYISKEQLQRHIMAQ